MFANKLTQVQNNYLNNNCCNCRNRKTSSTNVNSRPNCHLVMAVKRRNVDRSKVFCHSPLLLLRHLNKKENNGQ